MSASAHLAVLRNPFSTAVANAKLPDGATSLSTSCRYSHSRHVSAKNGRISLIITPNITCPITAFVHNASDANEVSTENFTYAVNSRKMTVSTTGTTFDAAFPSQYRVVSQGCRLSLINNSSDNDGWFEAIRINPSYDSSDYNAVRKIYVTEPEFANDSFTQRSSFEEGVIGTLASDGTLPVENLKDWSMHPSYIAGRLRDINKHTFLLHREDEGTYIEATEASVGVTASDDAVPPVVPQTYTGGPWWVDTRMDTVLIRIRANGIDTTTATSQVAIHVHSVQHVEECYDPSSSFGRYQTSTPVAKAALSASLTAMRRDLKPSILRVPTGAVAPTYSPYKRKRRYYRRTATKRRTKRKRSMSRRRTYRRKR